MPSHWALDTASPINQALSAATISGALPRMIGYPWLMSARRYAAASSA
jgi:hypothetical protein